jgi:hypothetical protein
MACITNREEHCVGPKRLIRHKDTGIQGTFAPKVYQTDIEWSFQDDLGRNTTHWIKNVFYIPDVSTCLLSPQHWAKSKNDHFPIANGTFCTTYDRSIVLVWDQHSHKRTIDLPTNGTNVGTIQTVPSFKSYAMFMDKMADDWDNDDPICAFHSFCANAQIIATPGDDAAQEDEPNANELDDEQTDQYFPVKDDPMPIEFDLDRPQSELPANDQGDMSTTMDSYNEDNLSKDLREFLLIHH